MATSFAFDDVKMVVLFASQSSEKCKNVVRYITQKNMGEVVSITRLDTPEIRKRAYNDPKHPVKEVPSIGVYLDSSEFIIYATGQENCLKFLEKYYKYLLRQSQAPPPQPVVQQPPPQQQYVPQPHPPQLPPQQYVPQPQPPQPLQPPVPTNIPLQPQPLPVAEINDGVSEMQEIQQIPEEDPGERPPPPPTSKLSTTPQSDPKKQSWEDMKRMAERMKEEAMATNKGFGREGYTY